MTDPVRPRPGPDPMSEQVIYKYRITVGASIGIPWGPGTRVTHSWADAEDSVTFWCVHQARIETGTRDIEVVPTGVRFPEWLDVLSTARHDRSGMVWHLTGSVIR